MTAGAISPALARSPDPVMSWRRFLPVLVLLGLLFGQTAHAQEAESALDDVDITVFTTSEDNDDQSSPPPASPGPAVNYNVTLASPDATFLSKLFSADVSKELPENSDVGLVTDFQWKRFLNRSDSIPFFLCATNGHRGYHEMMTAFNQTHAIPLFANASISCQLIHASAGTVLNVTAKLPQIVNGGPIPSVVKISKDLRERVDMGIFFNTTSPRLRLVMSPGVEQDQKVLRTVLYRIVRRLRSGEFMNVVEEDFEWAAVGTAADPSTAARRQLLRRRVRQRQRDRLLMMQTGDDEVDEESLNRFADDQPLHVNGAQTWANHVDPVLDGKYQCNFEEVAASIQYPYLRLSGFGKIVNAASEGRTLQYSNSTHSTHPGKSGCLMTLLAFVSSDPAVLFIEEYKEVELYNAAAAYVTQGGSNGIYDEEKSTFPYFSVGLDGKGQVVQVVDTGLDQNSCFFSDSTGPVAITTISAAAFDTKKRKVIQYVQWADDTDVIDGHGTHVAGSVVGESVDSAFDFDTYKGAAPGAKVAFFDVGFDTGSLSVPANFATRLFPPGYKAGARIFSNSWGTPAAKSYTTSDTEIDKFMHDNDDALIFVSGGNSGQAGLGSVASPALSKNVMSVGASLNERDASFNRDYVAYFSSWGPTLDGRIKPDALAPGRRVVSAAAGSNCGVTRKQGTSMSTPIAAGSATLVRQYFMEGFYPRGVRTATDAFVPTGALVKAMLINSAVPMKAVRFANNSLMQLGLPPDVYQGHGRIKLDEVLRVQSLGGKTTSNLFVVNNATIKEAEKHVYKLSVPSDSASPIKVTLVWIEPPTTASSASIVLHDLDLMIYSQLEKKAFYPNGLSNKDAVNTVEKVVLYTPTAGDTLTVTVTGTSIATRPLQKYALVASGDFLTGAWYCQFPQGGRAGEEFTTENCAKTCDNSGNFKHPVCCNAAAGDVCDLEELSATLASGFECNGATKPVECLPSPGTEFTPAPSPSLGTWYCQFPRRGRSNDASTVSNCNMKCDDSGVRLNPVCCDLDTAGNVCNEEEQAAAVASGLKCDPATRPVDCASGANTPAPTSKSAKGSWYCQFPRRGRRNDASTISNCNMKCDDSGVRLNPVCCDLDTAGNVCNEEEQAAAVVSGLKCDPATRPVDCASGANTPAPTSKSAKGSWYCQFPRRGRSNDASTISNCNMKCDDSGVRLNPVCCDLDTVGNVCNEEEQAAAVASGLKCDPATRPVDCASGANTPAPTSKSAKGSWYCQFPRLGRSNDASTVSNCNMKCDDSGVRLNPVCCDLDTVGNVCNEEEQAAAVASGLKCDPATRPVDCASGANTPASTSVPPKVPTQKPGAPIAGSWYCQYPRETRSNEAYTLSNCRVKCDTSGLLKNPICCSEAEAGGVCNTVEYNSANLAGVQCDPTTMPVCEA